MKTALSIRHEIVDRLQDIESKCRKAIEYVCSSDATLSAVQEHLDSLAFTVKQLAEGDWTY